MPRSVPNVTFVCDHCLIIVLEAKMQKADISYKSKVSQTV